MKPRLLILILLIVGIPGGFLVWAALRIAQNEQVVVQQQFHSLMEQRLSDVNATIARHFLDVEAHLQQMTTLDQPDVEELRHISRTDPQVMQMFVLTPSGQLEYPSPADVLNSSEKSFLRRAAGIFADQHLTTAGVDAEQSNAATGLAVDLETQADQQAAAPFETVTTSARTTSTAASNMPQMGWFVWYWDGGLNLIYWNRRPSGQIVGTALDRPRWMADLVGQLPDRPATGASSQSASIEPRIRLVNAASDVLYQWGPGTDEATSVVCEMAVAAPLSSWRLQCLVAPNQKPGQSAGTMYGLAGGVTAAGIAVGLLVFVLIRDYTRDMRDAGRQVSFVNQVSHELKTPLTNICLYAELLDKDLDGLPEDNSAQPRKRLDVILSEGQRLSRLIGNVLTFARQKRQSLQVKPVECIPDDVIRQVLKHFEPALAVMNVRVESQLEADTSQRLDSDFLEQILGNLIGNVEKYATDSEVLTVRSHVANSTLFVDVIDRGPGISAADRNQVFVPFVRLSQDISSAAGTGIGLSISRDLARLHGGDVQLLDSDVGCHFQVTLGLAG